MKKHTGDMSVIFNEATKAAAIDPAESLNQGEKILHIRISDIEKHPENPLDEREIEELASQIVVNGYHIETIEVRPLDNGKYRLISGHRRTAAKRLLLERGEVTDDTMPCIIRNFEPPAGSDLTPDDLEILALISANRGQRQGRNLEERLREAKLLEPIARKIFNAEKAKGNLKDVTFRRFFATGALKESESTLQRLRSIEKLTDKAKAAVMSGKISETAVANLAALPPAKQDAYILLITNKEDDLDEGDDGVGTVRHVLEYVKKEKNKEKGIEDEPETPEIENEPEFESDGDTDFEPDTDTEPEPEPEREPKAPAPKKKSSESPQKVVSEVKKEADDWVSEKLEEYHRKNDKICFKELIDLCASEMESADDSELRSQWDLRRAAAQLAYDREIKREEED